MGATSLLEGSHSYDGNGNMTTAGELHLGYDDENQMVTAIVMATDWMTGSKTDYTYDGKMRLRKAVDYSWNWIGGTNGTWSLSSEKRYIYDGMLVVQERTSANTPSVTYTRGNDLSGTLQGAGGIGGMLARSQSYSAGSWLTHHFYHADGNGNITYLVNSSQTLGASYKYDPFGGTISSSGTYAGANRYRFSSKEVSLSTGTYYYGYRWYHPNLQRWLNRDPIEEHGFETARMKNAERYFRAYSQYSNLYQFVRNDALGLIDPYGLEAPGAPYWPPPFPPSFPVFPPTPPKPPCDECKESGGHYEPYWQVMGYSSPFQCANAEWDLNRDSFLLTIGIIAGGRIGGGDGAAIGGLIGGTLVPNAICFSKICVH